ncbi:MULTISPECIES: hypothetical protein [unclassified Streptomyces]|uniref:hypothetical protein n=1 Tax=unclassified Streptomyces TaxID=2593676 RepID=UPI000DD89FE1|nr:MULTISPECIES: hypothetical protein [unclassified Streptomyces]QZZ28985.1 hypothetical protein A7X85_24445 [Streptomyces sp. ST1015]
MRAHSRENDEAGKQSPQGRPVGTATADPFAGPQHLPRSAGNAAVVRAITRERREAHGESEHPAEHTAGTPHGSGAASIQRTADEELREAKTPEQIVAALKKSGHSEDDAWELMRYMTSQQFPAGEGQADFDILGSIKDASQQLQKVKAVRRKMAEPLLAKRWTIRHYTGTDPNTPPSFQEIVSTYDNAVAGRASKHTNVADWRSLGNIKFTFYLVAVDGKVPPRTWLNKTHWYAEWELDQIQNCWVSADLLERMNKPMDADGARTAVQGAKAFRGTGAQLKELLAISAFGAGNDPASALDTAIGGAFELKVPDGLTVPEWRKK